MRQIGSIRLLRQLAPNTIFRRSYIKRSHLTNEIFMNKVGIYILNLLRSAKNHKKSPRQTILTI